MRESHQKKKRRLSSLEKIKKKKEKHLSSSSSESSSSDSSSDSSSEDSTSESSTSRERNKRKSKKNKKSKKRSSHSKRKSKFFTVTTKRDKFKWKIANDMAKYANKMAKTYIPDKDLEENILLHNQVPDNINKTPTLDDFMNKLVEDNKANAKDKSLHRISKKITDIYAPLSKVWGLMESFKSNKKENVLDVDMVTSCLQQTVMLTGQAIGAVTFNRRRNILNSLLRDDNKSLHMLRDSYPKELKKNEDLLFGEEFRKRIEKDAKADQKSVKQFLSPARKIAFTRKPFPSASPSKRPGGERQYQGNFDRSKSTRSEGNFRAKHSNSNRGKRTYLRLQHTSDNVIRSSKKFRLLRKHSQSSKKPVSTTKFARSPGRKVKIIRSTLEKVDKRQNDLEHNNRMEYPIHAKTFSKNTSKLHFKQKPSRSDNTRGFKYAGERGNNKSCTPPRSSNQQHISKRKKGGRDIPTYHKSKTCQPVHPIPKIQNGNPEKCKNPSNEGRLLSKIRFKGCLFQRSTERKLKKIHPIRVARKPIRVHMPNVRLRSSPKSIYKNNENPHISVEKTKFKDDNLHGRHVNNGKHIIRNTHSQRHHNLPLTVFGICDKFQKIDSNTVSVSRILGSNSRQFINDTQDSTGKDNGAQEDMYRDIDFQKHIVKEASKSYRKTSGHSPSFHVGTTTNTTPPTSVNHRNQEGKFIRDQDCDNEGSQNGIRMVDKKNRFTKWEPDLSEPSRNVYVNGCTKGDNRRMGGRMSGSIYRGTLDHGGENVTHQRTGAFSSRIGVENFHKTEECIFNPPQYGQYNSSELPGKNGRDKEYRDDKHIQENMVLSNIQNDHSYTGIYPVGAKYNSRLGIEKLGRLQRMEIEPQNFPKHLLNIRHSGSRSICVKNVSPAPKLHELETRPTELGNQCSSAKLEFPFSIRFPPFLSNRTIPTKNEQTQKSHDYNHPGLGVTTMVPSTPEHVYPKPDSPSIEPELINKPDGRISPSPVKLNIETSSLVSVGKIETPERFSSTASSLISRARSKGTRVSYESSWRKFTGWCTTRQVSPFCCDLKYVLEFLGDLFDEKLEYRTINNYRSALSAYHHPVDGMKVGQHPLVTSLMKGVSNERPPLPRYLYIWDVELVIEKMRSLPVNSELSLELLSNKLITLLGLCTINRSSELAALNIKWMVKYNDRFTCSFGIKVKHSKKGKPAPPIDFYAFPENEKLCPMTCLQDYIDKTKDFRELNNTQLLFLSILKPHKPVTRSTLTKWILKMLKLSGIDVTKFKSHSMRSASSSKVASLGLQTKDILKMGNWSSASVWQKFYHKKIYTPSERYQKTLLTKTNSFEEGRTLVGTSLLD